jgi:hypothetical protein
MNICIKQITTWLTAHPKIKQWLWFIALWIMGLLTVIIFTYPIKLLFKSLS